MILRRPARRRARGRTLTFLACLGLALGAGCKKRETVELTPAPGIGNALVRPAAPSTTPAPTTPEPVEHTVYDFERTGIPTDPGALTVADSGAAPPAPVPSEPEAPPRDLAAELSSALSGASSCVDVAKVAAQPGGKLTISVTTTVLGTGALSRPEVKAPGQPQDALRCLEQQVASLKLDGDIPDAPLRVTASTELQVKAVGGTTAGMTGGTSSNAPAPAPTNPDIARAPTNPDIARPEPPDYAKPEPPDLAGPP
jgi:hypothetical protein